MAVVVPYVRELKFEYGVAATVNPLVRRVVAKNPSAFTFHGTGTYIVGKGHVAIVDPGPDDAAHVDALLNAVRGETVSHILITHTHMDHSPATAAVKRATGATVYGYGPHPRGEEIGAEGGDMDYAPDVVVKDGDVIEGRGWTSEAIHTPGHISNHLCFTLREQNALFSGDHVMGWSTTVVSPPDGSMTDYMASLRKVMARPESVYIPTHGPEIRDAQKFVGTLIEHRLDRERQILACLTGGPKRIPEMVAEMYVDVPKHLHGAAGRSVFAHIVHMAKDGRIATADGAAPRADSIYRLP